MAETWREIYNRKKQKEEKPQQASTAYSYSAPKTVEPDNLAGTINYFNSFMNQAAGSLTNNNMYKSPDEMKDISSKASALAIKVIADKQSYNNQGITKLDDTYDTMRNSLIRTMHFADNEGKYFSQWKDEDDYKQTILNDRTKRIEPSKLYNELTFKNPKFESEARAKQSDGTLSWQGFLNNALENTPQNKKNQLRQSYTDEFGAMNNRGISGYDTRERGASFDTFDEKGNRVKSPYVSSYEAEQKLSADPFFKQYSRMKNFEAQGFAPLMPDGSINKPNIAKAKYLENRQIERIDKRLNELDKIEQEAGKSLNNNVSAAGFQDLEAKTNRIEREKDLLLADKRKAELNIKDYEIMERKEQADRKYAVYTKMPDFEEYSGYAGALHGLKFEINQKPQSDFEAELTQLAENESLAGNPELKRAIKFIEKFEDIASNSNTELSRERINNLLYMRAQLEMFNDYKDIEIINNVLGEHKGDALPLNYTPTITTENADEYNLINLGKYQEYKDLIEQKKNEIAAKYKGTPEQRSTYQLLNDYWKTGVTYVNNQGNQAVPKYGEMTEDEQKIYNYLFNTKGAEAAQQFLDDYAETLKIRHGIKAEETAEKIAKEHPLLAGAIGTLGNTLQVKNALGMSNAIETLQGGYDKYSDTNVTMRVLDTYSREAAKAASYAFVDAKGKPLKIPFLNVPVGEFLYDTGNSLLENGVRMSLGSPLLAKILCSTSAAGQTLKEAQERGLDPTRSFVTAVSSGLVEYVTERYSIDAFFKEDGNFLKQLLRQFITEGSEEGAATLLNTAVDRFVNADKNEIQTNVEDLLIANPTLNRDAARKMARMDWLQGFGVDVLAGAISGGVFGVIGGVRNEVYNSRQGKALEAQGFMKDITVENANGESYKINPIIDFAQKNMPEGSISRAEADKLAEKSQKHGAPSSKKVGRLMNLMLIDLDAQAGSKDVSTEERQQARDTLYRINNDLLKSPETMMEHTAEQYSKEDNRNIKEVVEQDKIMSSDAKNDLQSSFEIEKQNNGSLTESEYTDAYTRSFMAGLLNIDSRYVEEGYSDKVKKISEATAMRAFQAGVEQRNSSNVNITADSKRQSKIKSGEGTLTFDKSVNIKNLGRSEQEQITLLRRVANVVGVNIEMYESDVDETGRYIDDNGRYDFDTGTLYIDVHAGLMNKSDLANKARPIILKTAGHELTHFIKDYAPEQFSAYANEVTKLMIDNNQDLDSFIDNEIESYRSRGRDIDYEGAFEEVIANASEMMLQDSSAVQRIANENPTLAHKISNWIKNFAQRIRNAFKEIGVRTGNKEALSVMEQDSTGVLKYADNLVKLWDDALVKASGVQDTVRQKNNIEQNNTIAKDNLVNGKTRVAPKLKEGVIRGREGVMYSSDLKPYNYTYGAVNIDDVLTSYMNNYPQELQPREARKANNERLNNMIDNLTPAMVAMSNDVTTGAPILRSDNVALAGNHRLTAIIEALKRGGEAAKRYTDYMKLHAAEFGLNSSDFDGKHILVRYTDDNINHVEFARGSNTSLTGDYSAPETAVLDAEKITNDILKLANPKADFDAKSNDGFVKRFLHEIVPTSEYGRFIDKNGLISQDGRNRVQNALFQKAYNDSNITSQMGESTEDNVVRNIIRAMTNAAPRVLLIDEKIKKGYLNDFSITQELIDAYQASKRAKDNNLTVKEYNPQLSMLETESESGKLIADYFDDNKRSSVKMTNAINFILDEVERAGNPNQIVMPGMERSKLDIVKTGLENAKQYEKMMRSKPSIRTLAQANTESQAENIKNSNIKSQARLAGEESARQILANAFEDIATTDEESRALENYRRHSQQLDKKETIYYQLQARIEALENEDSFDVDNPPDEYNRYKEQVNKLERQIDRADRQLLQFENAGPLRDILNRETAKNLEKAKIQTERAVERERAKVQRKVERAKQPYETHRKNELKDRIVNNSKELHKWLLTPNGKTGKSVPKVIAEPVANFLMSINEQSKRSLNGGDITQKDANFIERINGLREFVDKVHKNQGGDETALNTYSDLNGWIDLPPGFEDDVNELANSIKSITQNKNNPNGEYVLNRMNESELKALDKTIRVLKSSIGKFNEFITLDGYHVDELSNDTVSELKTYKNKPQNATLKKVSDFFNFDNATPIRVFKRLGKGGQQIFDSLQSGMDVLAHNANDLIEFSKNTWTGKQAKQWSEDVHAIDLDGDTVYMSTAHIMSLYMLSKRKQAQGHLYGAGFRVEQFKIKGKLYNEHAKGHYVTAEQVSNIINLLTPEQRHVADTMQHYMSTVGSDWGNQVTMARWGIEQFDEENYMPIKSDPSYLSAGVEGAQGNPMYKLLNMSMTKQLVKGANNRLMIDNAFDVFAAHMSDMASYNAMAMPLLDAVKWINYKNGEVDPKTGRKTVESVQDSIRNAFGDAGLKYVKDFIQDVNGVQRTKETEKFSMKRLYAFNRAAVAANLRVALLQPLAITRALDVLNAKSIGVGILNNMALLKQNIKEMEHYSGIALWKHLGFYDVNISRSLTQMVKRSDTALDNLIEKSFWLPETADRVTWGAIWGAAKYDVTRRTGLTAKNGDAFFKQVNKVFTDVIYNTQVVDSILTRSGFMRQNTWAAKALSSFKSEPTQTYNMIAGKFWDMQDDIRKGMSKGRAWSKHGKDIMKGFNVLAVTSFMATLAEAFAGAMRDDDDYNTFLEKMKDGALLSFIDNAIAPVGLPIINDLWEQAKRTIGNRFKESGIWGYASSNVMYEFAENLNKGINELQKLNDEKSTNYTKGGAYYRIAEGISQLSGIPVSNALREVRVIWNNTVGQLYPEKKLRVFKQYESKGYELLADAQINGDEETTERIRSIMYRKGFDDKKIYNGTKPFVLKKYNEDDIDTDKLQEFLEEGEQYSETEKKSLKSLPFFKAQAYEAKKTGKIDDLSKYDVYADFLDSVPTGKGLKDNAKILLDNGATQNGISGAISKKFKPQLLELYDKGDTRGFAELQARVLTAYESIGVDRNKQLKTIKDSWLKPHVQERYFKGLISDAEMLRFINQNTDKSKKLDADRLPYWQLKALKAVRNGDIKQVSEYSIYKEFINSIETGGLIMQDKIKELLNNGVSKTSISSAITKSYKDKYIELYRRGDETGMKRLENKLLDAYAALGYKRHDKRKTFREWKKSSKGSKK